MSKPNPLDFRVLPIPDTDLIPFYIGSDTSKPFWVSWGNIKKILQSGGGGTAAWGSIQTGTGIPSQTDLVNYLAANFYPLSSNPANYITSSALTAILTNYVTTSLLASTLTNYVTNVALTAILAGYVTNSDLTTILSDYVTTTALNTALANYVPSKSDTYTASGASFLDVPIPTGYSHHKFTMIDITAGTANSELWHRVGIGAPSVIQSGAGAYFHYRILGGSSSASVQFGGSSSDTKMVMMGAAMPTGSSGQAFNGYYTLYNPDGTTLKKQFNGNVSTYFNSGAFVGGIIQSTYTGTDAITSIRFLCSTGNISGTVIIESYL